jgi:hypothetical protein
MLQNSIIILIFFPQLFKNVKPILSSQTIQKLVFSKYLWNKHFRIYFQELAVDSFGEEGDRFT